MVNVRIFGVFRLDTGLKQMSAEAKSVRELLPMVLAEAKRQNPGADADMKALRGCVVVVNGKQAPLSAELHDGDEVMLVPAVAGG